MLGSEGLAALAAVFTASTAVLMYLIQRQNFLEAARPELVLSDWSRGSRNIGGKEIDEVTFKEVRNIGQGPALQVTVTGMGMSNGLPLYALSTESAFIIGRDHTHKTNGVISIYWHNNNDETQMFIPIIAYHSDRRRMRHVTTYTLLVLKSPEEPVGGAHKVAPGVFVIGYETVSNRIPSDLNQKTDRMWTAILQAASLRRTPAKRNEQNE